MGGHAQQGSDKGAAFMGLIGGAVLVGAILYGIVIWTNGKFEGHEAEKKAAVAVSVAPLVG
ncbi:hypothetical protein [Gemmatimonas sp.]|uniref:hypothetical protein n=1 Tax=Gemmatimonas sp. TaxID=1962908 RepID=UPI00286BA0BC|nr:hypothetical protein [Gemmatimonas sp.]